jgi:tetratricopeptide (TPR) repeat protein
MLGACLGLAVTALWMITDGPMGVRVEQVMEGKAVREIQMKAEAATAHLHFNWNQWMRGGEHDQTIRSMESLITAYNRSGDLERAANLASRLLANRQATRGADHWETLNAHADLGFILWKLKDYPSSERHFREALEGRLRNLGEAHWDTANAASMLSHAIDRQENNPEQALAFAQLAIRGFQGDQNPNIPSEMRQDQAQRMRDYIQQLEDKTNGGAKPAAGP